MLGRRALRRAQGVPVQHVGHDGRGLLAAVDEPNLRAHALGIDLDLELTQVTAEPFHRRDTGDGEQPVLYFELRKVA